MAAGATVEQAQRDTDDSADLGLATGTRMVTPGCTAEQAEGRRRQALGSYCAGVDAPGPPGPRRDEPDVRLASAVRAVERDRAARERDERAHERDERAQERDGRADEREAAQDFGGAAQDRRASEADRQAAEADRHQADVDRIHAARDHDT